MRRVRPRRPIRAAARPWTAARRAETPTGRRAAQVVLTPPRAAARLVLLPVIEATAGAERHGVFPWLEAITTSDDGKVGVRPELQYSTGFVGSVGLGMFYRRFPDPTSELVARFKTGGPNIVHAEVSARGPHWLGLILGAMWDRRDDRLYAGIGNPAPGAPEPVQARYRGDIYRAEALWYSAQGPLLLTLRTGVEGREYDADDVRGGPSVADAYGASARRRARRSACPARARIPCWCPGSTSIAGCSTSGRASGWTCAPRGATAAASSSAWKGPSCTGSRRTRAGRRGWASTGSPQIGGIDRALLLRFVAAACRAAGPRAGPVRRDGVARRCQRDPRPARRAAARSQRPGRHRGVPLADLVGHRRVAVRRFGRGGGPVVRRLVARRISARRSASACASTDAGTRATGKRAPRKVCRSPTHAGRASASC